MSLQTKTTWQHIRRSPYQALAAIMIMAVTFFIGLLFVQLSLGADKLLNYLEKKPQVVIFFNDSVTSEDQVADLKNKLSSTGKVSKMQFVTKDEALKIYQDRNKSDQDLLALVTAKTLPASLEIGAKNAVDLPVIYDLVKDTENIEEISYQKEIVSSLINVVDHIRKFGAGLVGFLLITSLFIVLTVVGMKISLRKDEIEVQRLIGASKWYIRWPFIFEGIIYGVFGAFLAWAVVSALTYFFTPRFQTYLAGTGIFPLSLNFYLLVLGSSVATGIVVGSIGSLIAVWRYLKN